jgi:hypothetical protein
MARSLGELGENKPPRKREYRHTPAPEYRVCQFCGRHLYRGMGVSWGEKGLYRCRRPCNLWPVTPEDEPWKAS